MVIFSIETSADETAAAVIKAEKDDQKVQLLSNVVASSLSLHAKTGGIIPEIAARKQIEFIIPVIDKALADASVLKDDIDSIAVTVGPGLIGSLLVGVETAKTLSYIWNKPIVPVNHLIGHIYANFIRGNPKFPPAIAFAKRWRAGKILNPKTTAQIEFPAVALLVSGGHTDLLLIKDHEDIAWLGGTRDDAAGEALDKIGRLLGLPYPAGPAIEKLSKQGNASRFPFPRPLIDSNDFDFSFSGLKTAALREVEKLKKNNNVLDDQIVADIAASTQAAVIDVLVNKTIKAAEKLEVKSILLGGGVSANRELRDEMQSSIVNHKLSINFFAPAKELCTDNAAMIGAAAFFNHKPELWENVEAHPELYFDSKV